MSIRHPVRGCGRKLISFVITLLVLALLVLLVREAYYRYEYPVKYETYISEASKELDVPETLIYAVIKTESGFDPEARSEVGARGLMQITEETFDWLRTKEDFGAKDVTFQDLDSPDVAIAYGTYFLHILLEEFEGDTNTALSAYHAGRGSVHSWLENPEYSKDGQTLSHIPKDDTAFYVQKVNRAEEVYRNRLSGKKPQNELLRNLLENVYKFIDAYVVPRLQSVFDRLSGILGGRLNWKNIW